MDIITFNLQMRTLRLREIILTKVVQLVSGDTFI